MPGWTLVKSLKFANSVWPKTTQADESDQKGTIRTCQGIFLAVNCRYPSASYHIQLLTDGWTERPHSPRADDDREHEFSAALPLGFPLFGSYVASSSLSPFLGLCPFMDH